MCYQNAKAFESFTPHKFWWEIHAPKLLSLQPDCEIHMK